MTSFEIQELRLKFLCTKKNLGAIGNCHSHFLCNGLTFWMDVLFMIIEDKAGKLLIDL